MGDSTRLVITVTEELHQALSELADERGQSVAHVMREAAAAYLERSKKRVNEIHPTKGGGVKGPGVRLQLIDKILNAAA